MINVICLWLSFSFADDYYNQYCCGRCCTKCCFPCIKTVTLTCNEYEIEQRKSKNGCCTQNKCMIYCKCCCGSSCRYCCGSNNTAKDIYQLAKGEIELIVSASGEKSLTMSQMAAKDHSCKDVVSSIEKSNRP
eukprot:295862_1